MITRKSKEFFGVFRKCKECGTDVLVKWHAVPGKIVTPQSCKEHN